MASQKRKKTRRSSSPNWSLKVRKVGVYLAEAFALPKLPSLPSLPSFKSLKFGKGRTASARSSRSKVPSRGAKSAKQGKLLGPGLVLAVVGLGLGWKAQEGVVTSPQFPGWAQWGPYLLAAVLFGVGILLASWPGGKFSPKAFWAFLKEGFLSQGPKEGLKPRTEWTAFAVIMVVAAFFRIFRIGSVPSGMFIDQGMEGWSALRIIHEGFRPVWEFDVFQNPALLLYQLAAWFVVMPVSQGAFYLFFAVMSLTTLPLVYWTFREIAGPRLALVGLALLAVMRWNINFARNGFPTNQVPLYTFGTLAFLLYGIRTGKRWAFYVAATLFAMGLYTYQAYKIVPFLVLLFALYELATNRKAVLSKWKPILGFCALFLVLAAPYIEHTYRGGLGSREASLSILSRVKQAGNWQPLVDNIARTAVMFHWRGDGNGRHNLQDHRMLDDVTGVLLFIGIVLALFTLWRKSSFYGLLGFLVMSVPCILSIDPAHANRMLGTTPFMALLAALPLTLFWGLVRRLGGKWGEKVGWVVLAAPLLFAAWLNFDTYFNKQANNVTSWQEYAPQETSVGKAIRDNKDRYDYFLSPRYYNYYSINFLGYGYGDRIKPLLLPSGLISREPAEGRGLYFALEEGRTGLLELLRDLYPGGREEFQINPAGNTTNMAYFVEPEQLEKVRGLKAVFDGKKEGQVPRFPEGLPSGPYRAVLTGNLYLEEFGKQRIELSGNCDATLWIKGKPFPSEGGLTLERGSHPIRVVLDVPAGVRPELKVTTSMVNGVGRPLGPGAFNCLPHPRGLRGSYHRDHGMVGDPFLVEYDPVLNYTNGNDFSAQAPYSCRWTGTLIAPKAGTYEFLARTDNPTGLRIDGKVWIHPDGPKTARGTLTKGAHAIEVLDLKPAAYWPVFTLYWTPPGKQREVVPNSAFGLVP